MKDFTGEDIFAHAAALMSEAAAAINRLTAENVALQKQLYRRDSTDCYYVVQTSPDGHVAISRQLTLQQALQSVSSAREVKCQILKAISLE